MRTRIGLGVHAPGPEYTPICPSERVFWLASGPAADTAVVYPVAPMRIDLDKYREAGRIASEARNRAVASIAPGVTYVEVLDAIESYIRSRGADLAFPAQVSVNSVAAHDWCGAGDPRGFAAAWTLRSTAATGSAWARARR